MALQERGRCRKSVSATLALTNSITFADYGGERSRHRDSQLRDALSEIPFGDDGVPSVDGLGLMPGELHRDWPQDKDMGGWGRGLRHHFRRDTMRG